MCFPKCEDCLHFATYFGKDKFCCYPFDYESYPYHREHLPSFCNIERATGRCGKEGKNFEKNDIKHISSDTSYLIDKHNCITIWNCDSKDPIRISLNELKTLHQAVFGENNGNPRI